MTCKMVFAPITAAVQTNKVLSGVHTKELKNALMNLHYRVHRVEPQREKKDSLQSFRPL